MNRRGFFSALAGTAASALTIEQAKGQAAVLNRWPTIDQPFEQWMLIAPYRVGWSGWNLNTQNRQLYAYFLALPMDADADPAKAYPNLVSAAGAFPTAYACRFKPELPGRYRPLFLGRAFEPEELDGFLRIKALIASRDWQGYWERQREPDIKQGGAWGRW